MEDGVRLYRGDVVSVQLGPELARAVVRQIDGDRAMVQIGNDWTWVFTRELHWDGDCLVKLPRTERGWRKLGSVIRAGEVARRVALGLLGLVVAAGVLYGSVVLVVDLWNMSVFG